MPVYKGDQPWTEFVFLCSQSLLFPTPIAEKDRITRRLEAMAVRVVEELGPETSWADLKDALKRRAAGKILYGANHITDALDTALRVRRQ